MKTASDCRPNFTITFFFKGLDVYENLSHFSRLHSLQIEVLIEAELTEFISEVSMCKHGACKLTVTVKYYKDT